MGRDKNRLVIVIHHIPGKKNNGPIISNNDAIFGICVLEATNITSQVENNSDIGTAISDQIYTHMSRVCTVIFYGSKAKKNKT
ncbi:1260_t:CDS:2 [Racocetra fulgida]|uniref:1260_t:CDS:1 n=1 Tax=Racocetra fulgida TaxID=60492 RepID=A0A9N9AIH3_9GLOM|nr:1260_t:CDS:2 [Racocetra fulgida]